MTKIISATKEEIYAVVTGYFLFCSMLIIFWFFAMYEKAPIGVLTFLIIVTIMSLSWHTLLNATKLSSYVLHDDRIKIPRGYTRPIWRNTVISYNDIQSIYKAPKGWVIIKTCHERYFLQTNRKEILPYLKQMMSDRWNEVWKG